MRVEIRADCVVLDGYVSAVGRDSRPISSPKGKFIEQIEPQTFAKSLRKNPNVELRFNHSEKRILGSTQTGELDLYEDNIGLRAKCTVTDPEVMEKARRNELRGWSFGFYKNKDRWEDTDKGMQRRYLEDIDLIEVSILDKTPAYIATSIEQRGNEENAVESRAIEDEAETVDLSKSQKDKPNEQQEQRDLIAVRRRKYEYLKMKGGIYNEK